MKVLIADKFEQSGIDGLKALGCDVTYDPGLKEQALIDALQSKGAEVLIVRGTKVGDAAMPSTLKLIVRAGAGVNTIDIPAATARKIAVANCPGKNAIAVAELTMGLILALDRRLVDNVTDLRAGKWNKKEYSQARGLYGRTLGLIGAGSIACEVMRRAAAFGMSMVIWSRRFDGQSRPLTEAEAAELNLSDSLRAVSISVAPSPADVAARADVLSIHLAMTPETRGLINADVLTRLKPGSYLVNTARGEVLDHAALRVAVRDRQLRVALDVFASEPAASTGEFVDDIVQVPGVYGTHHIGGSTDQAQEAIAAETVRIVRSFMDTGRAPNSVKVDFQEPR